MGSIRLSNKIGELSKEDLLQRAKEYIFSTGLNDGASKLCKANMKYGLAQFHLIQEKYGFKPKATFISSPDETISRNNFRWNSGLGYGGRLNWGDGDDKLIFLNSGNEAMEFGINFAKKVTKRKRVLSLSVYLIKDKRS